MKYDGISAFPLTLLGFRKGATFHIHHFKQGMQFKKWVTEAMKTVPKSELPYYEDMLKQYSLKWKAIYYRGSKYPIVQ